MWPFSKKRTIAQSGILAGCTDHHSHILPGVDDGVESMDEALRLLATYEAAGVKELWLTPHIMEDIPNTPEKLQARFAELTTRYKGSITLHLAAEYMIDNHLRSLLNNASTKLHPASEGRWHEQGEVTEGSSTNNNCPSFKRGMSNAGSIAEGVKDNNNSPSFNEGQLEGALHGKRAQETALCHFEPKGEISTTKEELLPIGAKHNHLLVETSYFNPPMRLHETLRQIKSLGYHPLLAHPERYMYMDEEEYIRLHQEGVKFQLNLPSICGGYGNAVKKRAQWLLKKGLYDVIGSDTHSEEGVEYLLGSRHKEKDLRALQTLLSQTLR